VLTLPVVPEFVLIRHPLELFLTTELEKVTPSTTLLLFPPMEPMLKPCPPLQTMLVTVIFVPLVTATQSSWFVTVLSVNRMLFAEEKSNPSEL
jgi:hypothetical protein